MFARPAQLTAACFAILFALAAVASADVAEWTTTTITTDAETPLAPDVRRIMSAGYYDASVDQTFISFTGADTVPHVAAYDHAGGFWSNPVAVPMHTSTDDNHDYSHIFKLGDGRVGLTTSDHNNALYFAKSENPGSIGGTWDVQEVGSGLDATYPMPMVSRNDGSVSILYRETKSPTDYRPINIVRSEDNGQTWSAPAPAIDYNNSRADYMNEIYLGAMSYQADHPSATLGEGYHGTWTLAGGGGPDYGHKHDRFHKNMYYAFFSLTDQQWYAADGTNLGTNITDNDAETYAKVFDSGALEGNRDLGQQPDVGYTSKAVLDADGNPLVAFQNGKTNSIDIGRWDGSQWNVSTPTTFENTRALKDLINVDGKVWLMEDEGNGARVVELQDDGSWQDVAQFTAPTNANDIYFIEDGQADAFALAIRDRDGGGVYSVSTEPAPPEPETVTVTAALGSVDRIVGRQQENGPGLGYDMDANNGLAGTTGSNSGSTRYEANLVMGYALPTLEEGQTITSAKIYFEITAARDHSSFDPTLDVYLIDDADPSDTGTGLFFNEADDASADVAKIGGIFIEVGESTTTYPDDTQEFALTLTGEALAMLNSFYGGDHTPDQAEAFFRFNLDKFAADISSSSLNRYIVDVAPDETRLELEVPVIPEPGTFALLGLGGLLIAGRRRRARVA